MRHRFFIALSVTTIVAPPVAAQTPSSHDAEITALRAEIAALRAEVQTLEARIDQEHAAKAGALPVSPTPVPMPTQPVQPAPVASPQTAITWKGAPELRTADGWSFKPNGRIQVDVAGIDAPAGVTGASGGAATELRRVYLGADGTIPGGFGYRIVADLANSSVNLSDVYIRYGTGPLSITVGHTKPFWALDELTSDGYTSFTERAAFTQAFGFERRVGLSAQFKRKALLMQAGVFGDSAKDLLNDANNSVSFDARAVFMPKIGNTQLHLAASGHWRSFNDAASMARYRTRPFIHTTDVRLVDTGALAATGERGLGLEAAALIGPFHIAGEGFWQTARRPGLPDPTFFGGYIEAGVVLTPGDKRGYKDGAFGKLIPGKGIDQDGIGAIEVNARYDYLDLNDQGIIGGKQRMAGIALVWAPIQYVRITANYGHLKFSDAAVATPTGDRDYSADTFALRTQIDF